MAERLAQMNDRLLSRYYAFQWAHVVALAAEWDRLVQLQLRCEQDIKDGKLTGKDIGRQRHWLSVLSTQMGLWKQRLADNRAELDAVRTELGRRGYTYAELELAREGRDIVSNA